MTILSLYRGAPGARAVGLIAVGLASSCLTPIAHADPAPTVVVPLDFGTNVVRLDYGNTGTFLTGIRGDNIVGNYTIPDAGTTGGLYYNLTSKTWSAMPVATPNGANYPGATGSSPYGPSFGNPGGVLRVVGSYLTADSNGYDLSYLYDGAAAPGDELTELVYPGSGTLYTIAHSTFGNQVVGNYDTQLDEGHAFIYNIDTDTYTPLDYSQLNQPAAVSTTAYGIYGDMIAGGYTEAQLGGGGLGPQHGYIYDQRGPGTFTRYDHPGEGVVATHFEGITGGGQPDTYNLVANWVTADLEVHAGIMHLAADGTVTWYEFDMEGADTVSSNSAYGDNVVGIYTDADGIHGYVATIAGIYNPTVNDTETTFTGTNAAFLDGEKGEDIINNANITATGNLGVAIRGEEYGVITNNAVVSASGPAGAAAEMHGRFGTLLNTGTLRTTSPEADVLRTDLSAEGTIIVNSGIIDGRLAMMGGAGKRFENSGWLGVSGTGVSIEHLFLGTMVNTAAGTYAARITEDGRDRMIVDGALRLDGTLSVTFQTDTILKSYALMQASELTGAFRTIDAGIFAGTADYSGNIVTLNLSGADLATRLGLTANQHAVGGVIDDLVNTPGNDPFNALPAALAALYGLTAGQVPGALDALSGEAYASQQSVLIGDSFYVRQSILERLRQGSYAGQQGPMAPLGYGSAVLAYGPDAATPVAEANAALATGPVYNHTFWAQGFGVSADYDGGSETSAVDATMGGIIAGVDMTVDNWLVGAALGYTQSSSDVDELNSSSDVDSALVALYAGTSFGPRNIRFGGSYAFSQVDASRTIAYPGYVEQANADYNAGVGQIFAEVSQGFVVGQAALEPFAGLAYVHVATDSFTETGASAGLSADSTSSGLGYSSLGIRAATTMQLASGMALKPHAGFTWQHAFGDVTPEAQMAFISVPSANFTVAGAPLARDAALVDLGLDLDFTPQASIGVSYLGQYGEDVTVNALQADLRLRF